MPVNHVQSRAWHVIVLADAGLYLRSVSTGANNRMLPAGDLTATDVIVNKCFLNVTYRTFTLLVRFYNTWINKCLRLWKVMVFMHKSIHPKPPPYADETSSFAPVIITVVARGLCHLNANIFGLGALAEMTDARSSWKDSLTTTWF